MAMSSECGAHSRSQLIWAHCLVPQTVVRGGLSFHWHEFRAHFRDVGAFLLNESHEDVGKEKRRKTGHLMRVHGDQRLER